MTKLPLLLLPVLVACATTVSVPAGSVAPAGIAAGTYTTTIAASDLPASAPAEMRSALVGTWEMIVDGSGRALVSFNGRQVVDTPYQVNGSEISFGTDTGEYACNSPARYTWRMAGGQLFFTRIEDSCQGRVVALTTHPWTRR
ncbi:MAG TPA: hypothetical protein VF746_14130 [Longimicrobium sp.]|jgi:hypothetical protein